MTLGPVNLRVMLGMAGLSTAARGMSAACSPVSCSTPPHGADGYVPLYRFSLIITDLSERDITLTAESISNAYTPIAGWLVFRDIPPDPEMGKPGYIEYFPMTLPPEYWQPVPTGAATLHVVPAPGAMLALAAILPCVRRRRASFQYSPFEHAR